jgi:pimeloyl-ACP methyl ester carboxylesterase
MTARVPERRGARYWTLRGVRLLVVSYVAVLGFLYVAQAWLIFPGRMSQGKAWSHVERPPAGAELVRMRTAGGDEVVGLFGRALDRAGRPREDAASRPTILFFYGNGDCLANNLDLFRAFRRIGANVLIPDYVGYGMSGGSPGERECAATADAALDHLLSRGDVDPSRIVVAGWSLGSGVAVDLASRRPVAALAIFCPFTSLTDMARLAYPFIPVSWLLSHRFESETKLARIECPVLIGHGRVDTVIPFAMSEQLARVARGPVTFVPVDGADHNSFFAAGDPVVFDALERFLSPGG